MLSWIQYSFFVENSIGALSCQVESVRDKASDKTPLTISLQFSPLFLYHKTLRSPMKRIHRQILQNLSDSKMGVYRMIDLQDFSLAEFFNALKALKKASLIHLEDGMVSLTPLGRRFIEDQRVARLGDPLCDLCMGTGYRIEGPFKEIMERFKDVTQERPPVKEEFDQGYMSHESVLRKIIFMYERGDLGGHIFVLGDDDLLSIALALTRVPERIFVVDIDEELLSYIDSLCRKYDLSIEVSLYDVRRELPGKLMEKFDVFVSDPVETHSGFKLFLSRAAQALRGEACAGYFGITTLEASRKKWYSLQRMIYRANFVITDIKRKYTVYPADEKNFFRFQHKLPIVKRLKISSDFNWYKSSLIRIEAIRKPRPLILGACDLGDRLYRDSESWATPE